MGTQQFEVKMQQMAEVKGNDDAADAWRRARWPGGGLEKIGTAYVLTPCAAL